MSEDERRGVCVICARRGATGTITVKSDKYPERTYQFFVHPACVKEVAKPGFAGVKDL